MVGMTETEKGRSVRNTVHLSGAALRFTAKVPYLS